MDGQNKPIRCRRTMKSGVPLSPEDVGCELPPLRSIEFPGGMGQAMVRVAAGANPVLLLHGWAITADFNFCHVMSPLAQRFGVVVMDLRGHGRGLPLSRTERFGITQCADDAAALLDALDLDRVVVCGYSLGGPVALEFARRHRRRIAGLILQATALSFDTPGDRISRVALRALRPLADRSRGVGRSLPLRYFNRMRGVHPNTSSWWPWLRGELVLCRPRVIVDAILDEYAFDFRPHAPTIAGVPTVVVVTARDRAVPARDQRLMAKLLDATVIEIDADHDVFLADPDAYIDATVSAIDRLRCET
ncbi:alpha/beta hydrolase [Mycobacterium celatum]|uniref:Alpha/beta hydrolase n=3 Tax=Mycobacterium celatum TaxID=28045 RepID=A0A2G5PNQ1_MYCCE|nr:alpha/beta hydrolase [Mycobacterium celatum]